MKKQWPDTMGKGSEKLLNKFLAGVGENPLAVIKQLRINYTYDVGLHITFYPFSRCHLVVLKNQIIVFRYYKIPFLIRCQPEVICTDVISSEKIFFNYKVYYLKNIGLSYIKKNRITFKLGDPYYKNVTISIIFKNVPAEHLFLFKNPFV